ncbi:Cerato-platanin [Tylopilus felleus]
MKLFIVAAALVTPVFPQYTVWYDTFYDGTTTSLSSVACSTGEYGLIPYGYNTFGDLPSYPFIGGAPQIESWDSLNCGTCWELTYTDRYGDSTSANFTAINSSDPGCFTLSFAGTDILTNGNGERLDGASITAVQVPATWCGM